MVDAARRRQVELLLGRYVEIPGLVESHLQRLYEYDKDGLGTETTFLHPAIYDTLELMVESVGGITSGETIAHITQVLLSDDERSVWLATGGIAQIFALVNFELNIKAFNALASDFQGTPFSFTLEEFLRERKYARDNNWDGYSAIEWGDEHGLRVEG